MEREEREGERRGEEDKARISAVTACRDLGTSWSTAEAQGATTA